MPRTPAEYRQLATARLSDPTIGRAATIRREAHTTDQDTLESGDSPTVTEMAGFVAETSVRERHPETGAVLSVADAVVFVAASYAFEPKPSMKIDDGDIVRVIREVNPAIQAGEAVAYTLRLER